MLPNGKTVQIYLDELQSPTLYRSFLETKRCYDTKCPLCVSKTIQSDCSHLLTQWNDCPCLDHSNLLLISEILEKTQQV